MTINCDIIAAALRHNTWTCISAHSTLSLRASNSVDGDGVGVRTAALYRSPLRAFAAANAGTISLQISLNGDCFKARRTDPADKAHREVPHVLYRAGCMRHYKASPDPRIEVHVTQHC